MKGLKKKKKEAKLLSGYVKVGQYGRMSFVRRACRMTRDKTISHLFVKSVLPGNPHWICTLYVQHLLKDFRAVEYELFYYLLVSVGGNDIYTQAMKSYNTCTSHHRETVALFQPNSKYFPACVHFTLDFYWITSSCARAMSFSSLSDHVRNILNDFYFTPLYTNRPLRFDKCNKPLWIYQCYVHKQTIDFWKGMRC